MRDIVFEWYVPHMPDKKERLAKALAVSAAIVFFIDAVFFMAIMLIPALILGAAGFFLSRAWNYEYEYVYVNGDFTISKILHKSRRKDVFHADRTDFEEIVPGRKTSEEAGIRDFSSCCWRLRNTACRSTGMGKPFGPKSRLSLSPPTRFR